MHTSLAALRQQLNINAPKRLFAIADAAQDPALPQAIAAGARQQCLFGNLQGAPLFKVAPHLVQLDDCGPDSQALRWIAHHAAGTASVSLLESTLSFDALFAHLSAHLDVRLDDGDEKFLAFWDPAILAALVGQADDATLYVQGPILTPAQRGSLLGPVTAWWYWDRAGVLHQIQPTHTAEPTSPPPWTLTALQIDQLVEASVPDHVLHHLELNQPQLIGSIDTAQRYGTVRQHLVAARQLRLETMSDLVNYVCAALVYKERLQHDATISALLERVKQGDLNLIQALELMP
nr:DUF4123 domain-containing protein [uncultured Albidiferax sp.]